MIRKATLNDIPLVAALALELWPHHTKSEFQQEFTEVLSHQDAAIFLAFSGDTPIGFAQCQLRHDYVEGTSSTPVGYLEGIYVTASHRRQGYAKLLLAACEVWAREQGCTEFASDCELDNTDSLQMHLALGFTEANRIICFTKKLLRP